MADQQGKLARGEADTRGQNFASIVGQQHQDALSNFWNANQTAADMGKTAGTSAVTASGNEGNTASNIYGTAGKQKTTGTSAATGITESLCPAEGTLILMGDSKEKRIEEMKKGETVFGIDGRPDELLDDPFLTMQAVCKVTTLRFSVVVSQSHTFQRHSGGYCFAAKSLGEVVETSNGPETILTVDLIPNMRACRHILLKRSHGYNASGFWSFE